MAVNSEVYRLEHAPSSEVNPLAIKKCGLREATTFNGFCQKHDKEIFAPIEDEPFISTKEQLFLFCYRGILKEYYAKLAQIDTIMTPEQFLKIRPDGDLDSFLSFMIPHVYGIQLGLRDMEALKKRWDACLTENNYSNMIHYVVHFKQPPTVAYTSCFSPDYDLEGTPLQDLGTDTKMNVLAVTVSPINTGEGIAVFSYFLDELFGPEDFCNSLFRLKKQNISDALIKLVSVIPLL